MCAVSANHKGTLPYVHRSRGYRSKGLWGDASILDWFRLSVASSPDKCAVVDRLGRSLTFRDLDREAAKLATWMIDHKLRAGDVVGVQLPNWCEFTVVYVACLKVGATINPLPTNLRISELTDAVRQCHTAMTFHPTKFRNTEYEDLVVQLHKNSVSIKESVLVDRLGIPSRSFPTLSRIVDTSRPLPKSREHVGGGDSIAAVLFTSGSESAPKGVMLSHNNLIASERTFVSSLNVTWADSMFMPAPVGHATGFMHGVTMPLIAQITSVLCDCTTANEMVMMLSESRATGGMAVPAIAATILDYCVETGRGLPSLRFMCCGGSPVPRDLVRRARDVGINLYSVYGSTESAPHTMTTSCDSVERVSETDGRPCWGTEVKVVDPETRQEVPQGQPGEEASRGPAVFSGYLNKPDLTARVLDDDGWYYSGDICVMDSEGYIRIVGRIKDTVIRGGENIGAGEVESILRAYPRIGDAAVIGVDDPLLGQRLCACLVSRDGEEITVPELRSYFISGGYAKIKIPEKVVMLTELPLTPSGKVSKGDLRRMFGSGTC